MDEDADAVAVARGVEDLDVRGVGDLDARCVGDLDARGVRDLDVRGAGVLESTRGVRDLDLRTGIFLVVFLVSMEKDVP